MSKTEKEKRWKKHLLLVVLTVLGAVGGYGYYRFVGCASGTCVITSNPYISTIYGGVIGALIGSIVSPNKGRAGKENRKDT